MKKTLEPRINDRGLPKLPLIPSLLALAAATTAVSSAVETSYRYYRFTPTVNSTDTQTQTQISEFKFYRRGVALNISPETVTVTLVAPEPSPAAEGPTNLIDGNLGTKWFHPNKGTLVFDFGAPTTIDAYTFATANDSLDRTPKRWLFEGSNDGAAFVTIDNRNGGDNAVPNTLFTYRGIVNIGATVSLPQISNGTGDANPFGTPLTVFDGTGDIVYQTTPSILKNLPAPVTSNLTWNITGSTGVTLTPDGGTPVAVGATGPSTVTLPDGDTFFTLAATNTAGTAGLSHKYRTVPGTVTNARYIRYTATTLRGNALLTQVGEFEFFRNGVKVPVTTVTNPNGDSGGNALEVAAAAIDGNYRQKYLNHNNRPLIFDFGSVVELDSYQLTTANDATDRDPVRWIFETSNDGVAWKLLEAVNTYPMPVKRRTMTGIIPFSGKSYAWTGTGSGEWDTTASTNWLLEGTASPSLAFVNGNPAIFTDSSTVRDITITSPVLPSFIEVNNTGDPYSFTGERIGGPGGLIKRGSGELILNTPNTFNGSIYHFGGTLTLNDPNALGGRDSTNRLEFDGNSTLKVPVTVSTQRRMYVRDGGTIINVDGGSFTKIGVTDLRGTLRKTGNGTLRLEGYNGSVATAADDMIIDEGTVDFGTGYYAVGIPYPASSLKITVNPQGSLRLGASSALGGHHTYTTTSIEQVVLNGGTFDVTSSLTYFPSGKTASGQGRVLFQGGTMTGGGNFEPVEGNTTDVTTWTAVPSENPSQIAGSGLLALNPGNVTLITEEGAVLNISRTISGGCGIQKEGAGELILSGSSNSYSGTTPKTWTGNLGLGTNVTAGTLTLSNGGGSATGTSEVKIAAGAKLQGTGFATGNVTAAGTIAPGDAFTPVGTLTLGNTTLTGTLVVGVDSGEADKLAVTGTLNVTGASLNISGTFTESSYQIVSATGGITGSFNVTGVPAGYTLQASANSIVLLSNGATAYDVWAAGLVDPGMEADPDGDGIVNVLEFILNSDASVSSTADLPDVTTNPAGDLIFTFVRKSSSAYLGAVVEYSTDLSEESWTTFAGAIIQTNTPSAGLDTVTATLPASLAGPGGKIFARLKAELP